MRYNTTEDIRRANEAAGKHFFDENTLAFFKSKIYEPVIHGIYFITSEKGPDKVRRFTIRKASESGDITTVGKFQQYHDFAQAETAARLLPH